MASRSRLRVPTLLGTTAVLGTLLIGAPSAAPAAPLAATHSCAPLDIAILIDTTGSMGPAISNVKEQVADLTDEIVDASGGDYRIGLIEFGNDVSVVAPFAADNAEEIKEAVAGLSSGGGGDSPEAWDEALVTAIDNRASAAASGDQYGDFTEPWRPKAKKMIVLITDATPSGFDDAHTDEDENRAYAAAVRASTAGIRIATVFIPNGNQEDAAPELLQPISNASQSTYFATDPDGSNLTEGLTLTVSTCAADTDGDGLYDVWETDGYDYNNDNDNEIDVDLAAMGARPDHKDLFLQVNWMEPEPVPCYFGFFCPGTSHGDLTPDATALNKLVRVFANAPVENPDGDSGITVHIDAGGMTPASAGIGDEDRHGGSLGFYADALIPSVEDTIAKEAIDSLAVDHFAGERAALFTWVVYGDLISADEDHSGLLGLAPGTPGDTVLISSSLMTSTFLESATLVHEVGHTLGLRHGGLDHENSKANYLSIMNYDYIFEGGLWRNGSAGVIDFSSFLLNDLDEDALDETVGVTVADPSDPQAETFGDYDMLFYRCPEDTQKAIDADDAGDGFFTSAAYASEVGGPIDWNCDHDTLDSAVSGSIHNGYPMVLTGRDDWATITFTGGSRGGLESASEPVDDDLLTYQNWLAVPKEHSVAAVGPGSFTAAEGTARLRFLVSNTGTEDDRYDLVARSTGSWKPELTVAESIEVKAGETVAVPVAVTIPESAKKGDAVTVTLSVRSATSDWVSAAPTAQLAVGATETVKFDKDLMIEPEEPEAGTEFTISGEGFQPGTEVRVYSEDSWIAEKSATADSHGDVEVTLVAPLAPGEGTVYMVGASDDGPPELAIENPAETPPRALKADITVVASFNLVLVLVLIGLGVLVLSAGVVAGLLWWKRRVKAVPTDKAVPTVEDAAETS